jgi:hypothetical protein
VILQGEGLDRLSNYNPVGPFVKPRYLMLSAAPGYLRKAGFGQGSGFSLTLVKPNVIV